MRLLKTSSPLDDSGSLELIEAWDDRVPPYAILSHTWSTNPGDEVLFYDIVNPTVKRKPAYSKVRSAMRQAQKDGHEYIWIDTCCIDKTSSAELSEAINSMHQYYRNAEVCYVHLEDVPWADRLGKSLEEARWWTRGWTLQELLAPAALFFFAEDWELIGTDTDLSDLITRITGIDKAYLLRDDRDVVQHASIARRMSWAARRVTSRPEDSAYCLLGIFSVNMPLLYGEGQAKAFLRLQQEIMKNSDDHTIFAWKDPSIGPDEPHGLLADSPSAFRDTGHILPAPEFEDREPYALTNRGLRIRLHLLQDPQEMLYTATISCWSSTDDRNGFLALTLTQWKFANGKQFARVRCHEFDSTMSWEPRGPLREIYIPQYMPSARPPSANIYFRFPQPPNDYNFRLFQYDPDVTIETRRGGPSTPIWRSPDESPPVFKMVSTRGAVTAIVVLEYRIWPNWCIAFMLGCSSESRPAVSYIPWPKELDHAPTEIIHSWFAPMKIGHWVAINMEGCWRGCKVAFEEKNAGYGSTLFDVSVELTPTPPEASEEIAVPADLLSQTTLKKFGKEMVKRYRL